MKTAKLKGVTTYEVRRCPKCGDAVFVFPNLIAIQCGCDRRIEKEEFGDLELLYKGRIVDEEETP